MPEDGYQEIIPAHEFFSELTGVPLPSFNKKPLSLYLYVCPRCHWWDISNGVLETFGTLYHGPGARTTPCDRCGHKPMYLVARHEGLQVIPIEEGETSC